MPDVKQVGLPLTNASPSSRSVGDLTRLLLAEGGRERDVLLRRHLGEGDARARDRRARIRWKFQCATDSDHGPSPAENLVRGRFEPEEANPIWTALEGLSKDAGGKEIA